MCNFILFTKLLCHIRMHQLIDMNVLVKEQDCIEEMITYLT